MVNPTPLQRIAFLAALALAGCATPMKSTATCAFEPKIAGRWGDLKEATGKCAFTIEAKTKSAAQAKTFADAWRSMFLASPLPQGVEVDIRLKEAPKQ